MSPLRIEAFNPVDEQWAMIGEVPPTDQSGCFFNNKPDGGKEVLLFKCREDNSGSTIYRSAAGVNNLEEGLSSRTINFSRLEIVKKLKKGESFEVNMKTDKNPERRRIRFTHK